MTIFRGVGRVQTEETICVLEGEYEVFETIYIEGANMRDKELKIMNLGRSGKVVLDGETRTCPELGACMPLATLTLVHVRPCSLRAASVRASEPSASALGSSHSHPPHSAPNRCPPH